MNAQYRQVRPQRPGYIAGTRERKQLSLRMDPETIEWLEAEALARTARPPFLHVSISDVIRDCIRAYRAAAPDSKPTPRFRPCNVARTETGSYCAHCGATAGPGEEPLCGASER